MNGPAGRLAILGGGPSGLIVLKFALEQLRGWEIICYEKQAAPLGSWGRTHPRFVSTSTKYTTQFACFQKFPPSLGKTQAAGEEFFRADEFGHYLEEFTEHFNLGAHVRCGHLVLSLKHLEQPTDGYPWIVCLQDLKSGATGEEHFSHVVVCTGLANRLKPLPTDIATLKSPYEIEKVRGKTVVVLGGGETAVDAAQQLCQPDRQNKVYLSLRSGVRVSPRYHPIKLVPSDFLRTRLMMSIHEDIRNTVGQSFVKFRVRFDRLLGALYRSRERHDLATKNVRAMKARWNLRINAKAEGKLFNMFHNKSDDFLNSIADQRLSVLGPAADETYRRYYDFDRSTQITLEPDLLVGAIGYDSRLADRWNGGKCSSPWPIPVASGYSNWMYRTIASTCFAQRMNCRWKSSIAWGATPASCMKPP